MLKLDPDFRELLVCFNSKSVLYLVLGGYAVNFHGHHRNTKDFDLWIKPDAANAERVSAALQLFGFQSSAVAPERFSALGKIFAFGREPMRVDILTEPSGVDFDVCYARRVAFQLDGVEIPFISLSDLRKNKAASGRLRDLDDLQNLPPD